MLRGASAHAVDELRERGPTVRLAARDWLFRAGELGLLTGARRSASVRAVRESRLLELVEADGGFALSVARALARQLQASGGF